MFAVDSVSVFVSLRVYLVCVLCSRALAFQHVVTVLRLPLTESPPLHVLRSPDSFPASSFRFSLFTHDGFVCVFP